MLNFEFLEKVLAIVSPQLFVNYFLRKMFLIDYLIGCQLTKLYCLIVFPSCDIDNMCLVIVCFLVCDVINFEINLFFLIKQFLNMTKISR